MDIELITAFSSLSNIFFILIKVVFLIAGIILLTKERSLSTFLIIIGATGNVVMSITMTLVNLFGQSLFVSDFNSLAFFIPNLIDSVFSLIMAVGWLLLVCSLNKKYA